MPVRRERVEMVRPMVPWGLKRRIEEWKEWMHQTGFYAIRCEAVETQEPAAEEVAEHESPDSRLPVTDALDGVTFASHNPTTISQIVELGLEDNYKTAHKRIAQAVKKGVLQWIGKLKQGKGPPTKVASGYPSSIPGHEFLGSRFRGAYLDVAAERGPNLPRGCDLILRYSAKICALVEIDSGSVSHSKQRERWRQYDGEQNLLLVVTSSRERMKNLQANAERVAAIALFGVLDEVVKDPWGQVYEVIDGRPISLGTAWGISE